MLIVPELLITQAFAESRIASNSVATMKELGATHWTITYGYFANAGVFTIPQTDGELYALEYWQVEWLLRHGRINVHEISISNEEVKDRSNAVSFTKLLACAQIVWLSLQCIARSAQRLQISLLELLTCAFVGYAMFTYYFWRGKPLDIILPTILGSRLNAEDYITMHTRFDQVNGLKRQERKTEGQQNNTPALKPRNRLQALSPISTAAPAFVLWCSGVFFCALHCAAWNFDFPTPAEAYRWRLFAVISVGSAALGLLLNCLYHGSRNCKVAWLGWHATGYRSERWQLVLTPIIALTGTAVHCGSPLPPFCRILQSPIDARWGLQDGQLDGVFAALDIILE